MPGQTLRGPPALAGKIREGFAQLHFTSGYDPTMSEPIPPPLVNPSAPPLPTSAIPQSDTVSNHPAPSAAPPRRKPLDHLPAPSPMVHTARPMSRTETEEARWASTFSLGTFRLVLMPLLILMFLLWMLIWVIFGT